MYQFHFKHIKSVRNQLQNVGLYFLNKTAFLAQCGVLQQSDEHVINILNQLIQEVEIRCTGYKFKVNVRFNQYLLFL